MSKMIRQKDYQWEAAIKIAKADGADYVAILLGRLRDAQKEIEALEAAQQSVQTTGLTCPACQVERQILLRCPKCMSLDAPRV